MRSFLLSVFFMVSPFAHESGEELALISLNSCIEKTKMAEDFFQDGEYLRAFLMYNCAVQIFWYFESMTDEPMSDSHEFLRFRIEVGRTISEAFLKNEYDTLENRLQKVYEHLK